MNNEIDLGIATAVFISSFAIDALAALYTKMVAEDNSGGAALSGLLIGALGYINLSAYLGDPRMAFPELAGGTLGTFVIVEAAKRRARHKVRP